MRQRGEKKRIKINEDNLRDLWNNVKRPNIRIIGSRMSFAFLKDCKTNNDNKAKKKYTTDTVF